MGRSVEVEGGVDRQIAWAYNGITLLQVRM